MKPVTVDIKDLLEAYEEGSFDGVGASSGLWPIYIGSEPDKPNDCITLYDMPGDAPNPKWLLDYPRFMVRVRSRSYEEGYAKAQRIKGVLLGLPSQNIGDIRYVGVYVVTDVHYLKADQEGRKVFVSTWRTIIEPSPSEGEHRKPL